jgi:hypothetical protein
LEKQQADVEALEIQVEKLRIANANLKSRLELRNSNYYMSVVREFFERKADVYKNL